MGRPKGGGSLGGFPAKPPASRRGLAGGWQPVVSRGWRHTDRLSRGSAGRYLSFVEREEIALLRASGCGVREIARRLARSPSTISRELRRNASTRGGRLTYRATIAQWHAERRARRRSPSSSR